MPEKNAGHPHRKKRPAITAARISDILDQTQGHLILRWDAWRNSKHFSEIGIPSLYCLLALFFLVFFATESFLLNQTWHARILLVFAILTVCCFIYLRITGNARGTVTLIVLLFGALCLFLLYTGGVGGTGPLWYFVFPLVALFIQRLWAGLLSVVILLAITSFILATQPSGFDPSLYSQAFIERFFAVYIAVSVMSFFYAYARTSSELYMDDMNRSYQNLANTDELTRLANRRRMTDILYQEVSRSERNQRTFSIIIFDIDDFKKINDEHGHDGGDALLRAVPDIIRKVLRTPDICARWGGEEFLVLLPETNLVGARHVAERLRIAFEEHSLPHNDSELSVTISVGVSEFRQAKNVEVCIKQADKNLYSAKAAGRNCVIASTDMDGEINETVATTVSGKVGQTQHRS
jgi:diguanylate cyclase (GGDEF)-like protein